MQINLKRITVVFEMDVPLVNHLVRLEKSMNRLGCRIDHIYKYQDKIQTVGWIPILLKLIHSSENILVLRTTKGYETDYRTYSLYGVVTSYQIAQTTKIPIIDSNVDLWDNLSEDEFDQMNKSFISQFEHIPEIYKNLELRKQGISFQGFENCASQLNQNSKTILVLFDITPEVATYINRLENMMNQLGWEINHAYKHEEKINSIGWATVMKDQIYNAEYILALRTRHSYINRGLSGSKTGITFEYDLAKIYGVPMVNMLQSQFEDWTDEAFEEVCEGAISELLHIEDCYRDKPPHERSRFWD